MLPQHWQYLSRVGLILLVLLSGLALLPLTGLSAEKLGWELYAGIYEPDLDVIGEDRGFPGSAFLFEGVGYPPNTLATIYVEGDARGTLTTDGQGTAQFLIQSEAGDPLGRYFITMSTDANTSDTDDVRLEDDEPIIPPPPGWNGPTFLLFGDTLTPTPTGTATSIPTATSTGTPPPGTTATPTGTSIAPTETPGGPPTVTSTPEPPGPERLLYLPVMLSE